MPQQAPDIQNGVSRYSAIAQSSVLAKASCHSSSVYVQDTRAHDHCMHRMLSRELSDLLMASGGVDFAADAVGDDVFHWQLTFDQFTPACPLAMARALVFCWFSSPSLVEHWW